MKLSKLLHEQKVKVVIDEIELHIKKLTWKELSEFQDFASQDNEEDEEAGALRLCKYILERYVTDEEGDKVIDEDKIEHLPVQFCVKLVEVFFGIIRGEDLDEVKKK